MPKKTPDPKPAADSDQGGRPPFEPTAADRKMVVTLAGYGLTQRQISFLVTNPGTGKPIDEKTLREHFREELDVGEAKGDMAILQSLFVQAVGRPAQFDEQGRKIHEEMSPVTAATIFSAKVRKGIRLTERAAMPLPGDVDWSLYTDEDLETIARAQQLLDRSAPPPPAGTGRAAAKAH
jgi:hypothetical protein